MFKLTRIQPGHQQRIVAGIAVVVLIGVISTITVPSHAAIANAIRLATTHQPERFTELSFNNNRQLPTPGVKGANPHVSFHITNHEAQTVTYHYQVIQTVGANQSLVSVGSISLADGMGADQAVSYQLPLAHLPYSITVQLVEHPEVINFRSQS